MNDDYDILKEILKLFSDQELQDELDRRAWEKEKKRMAEVKRLNEELFKARQGRK